MEHKHNFLNHVTEKDIKAIVTQYRSTEKEDCAIESFDACNASDKMLGFLGDYWTLRVNLITASGQRKLLSFFIKEISRTNAAKAEMVKDLQLYDKERLFYTTLKKEILLPDLKAWSPRLVFSFNDSLVFEDLNELKYRVHDKFKRFDENHSRQALSTLARFHASSIVYEEKKSKSLKKPYRINHDYKHILQDKGYADDSSHLLSWYQQCKIGALETIKSFSKYSQYMDLIENHWSDIWSTCLTLNEVYPEHRTVICHRDLWNNNLLFHYREIDGHLLPDDCMLVDFQAVNCQPPAADVLLLLYCNLNRNDREKYFDALIEFYYSELKNCLKKYDVNIAEVIATEDFNKSVELHRKWALVICACLIPQIWIDDELTKTIFSDAERFDNILSKNKTAFIKQMIAISEDYKLKVMDVFDEIVERFCLNEK